MTSKQLVRKYTNKQIDKLLAKEGLSKESRELLRAERLRRDRKKSHATKD